MDHWDRTKDIQIRCGTFRVYIAGDKGPSILLLHGAGHSAMTWSMLAARLKQHCTLYAIDLRGHGATITSDDSLLSIETLVSDVLAVLDCLLVVKTKVLVVGHSMGGALAVHVSLNIATTSPATISGVVVIDVVEGTALAALDSAKQTLDTRPQSFSTKEEAIEWAVTSGTLLSIQSAQLSIPHQLVQAGGGGTDGPYVWRTDLRASERYWQGWFTDMSALFLSLKVPKMLMVAGTNRLDTPLTIAQVDYPPTFHPIHLYHPSVADARQVPDGYHG
jgi:protein phosphatase methylesterase 1